MKVFISQPMNGKTEEAIKAERQEIERIAKTWFPNAEIIDSYFEDYVPSTGNVALKYLSKSLELLADADKAIFAEGWNNARGCILEHMCASMYGIDTIELTNKNAD